MKKLFLPILRVAWLGALLLGRLGAATTTHAGPATSFNVVSTLDKPDANLGNGVCADDNGNCTLRAAIMEANAHAGPDTILLPADTFHLTIPGVNEDAAAAGDLDLLGQVTLQGVSAALSIVDAAGLNDRVIHVLSGAQASLIDLTIRGGTVPTTGIDRGGGLMNAGTLTVTRVLVTHNNLGGPMMVSSHGGGLANMPGAWLALSTSQVTSNQAYDGAIYNAGTMSIHNSLVYSNVTTYAGGIDNYAVLTIDSSQVLSNVASHDPGGIGNLSQLAISNSLIGGNKANFAAGLKQEGGQLTITGSTIRDNQAATDGGGLAVFGGTMTVTASTLTHNSAGHYGGGVYQAGTSSLTVMNTTVVLNRANGSGGGIFHDTGSFAAFNVTIADNIADADSNGGNGGGLGGSGPITLINSLLADNVRAAGMFTVPDDCAGSLGTFSYSLVGTDDGCTFTNDHTLVGANPHLLLLAENGGPTPTMALGPGSAALDAANPAGCHGPAGSLLFTDQRGLPRHADGNRDGLARCDMGAFEVQLALFLPVLRH